MRSVNEQILLATNDYETINACLKTGKATFNQHDAEGLTLELRKAKLVSTDELPSDVIRLNSTVTIKDEKAKKVMQVVVVTPDKADIKQRKISIFSPIGTALIGYRKGMKISWNVPAGKKTFTILDVSYPFP